MAFQKQVISTDKAPAAIGPYSQAIKVGDLLFMSGQIPVNPLNGEIVSENIEAQAKQSLDNLKAVITAAGGTLENIVKTTIFAVNINDFQAVNKIYAGYFEKEPPARSFVAVKELPKGAKIEIEAIAYI